MTLTLSPKYKAFIKHQAPVEFLEGTTSAGKTTVGVFKFMLKVAESPKKLHIIASKDTGTAEKNIINKDLGILDIFGALAEYNGNGTSSEKIPHLIFHTNKGDKIVYILGYDDSVKWKKALGGQYGCLYIDEINTAHIEFVREASMRCDYLMGTLNPDDPTLPIYSEYINHSRPLERYKNDAPSAITRELCESPKDGWTHWFFTFDDNAGLSAEKKAQIINNVPVGTKIYKNKIEGIRCKATGIVFTAFDHGRNVRSKKWLLEQLKAHKYATIRQVYENGRIVETKGFTFKLFTSAMDTSYSKQSDDTIAMIFQGITNTGLLITLDEKIIDNKALGDDAFPPSEVVKEYISFLEKNRKEWGLARYAWIDSADQATLREMDKYLNKSPLPYNIGGSYKKMKILDRIIMQHGWIMDGDYIVLDHCKNHIDELERYSYEEKTGKVEDRNDHTINANQYAWIPYQSNIGKNGRKK